MLLFQKCCFLTRNGVINMYWYSEYKTKQQVIFSIFHCVGPIIFVVYEMP